MPNGVRRFSLRGLVARDSVQPPCGRTASRRPLSHPSRESGAMRVWRKKTVRYVLDGRRVSKGTPGSVKRDELSKRFYGTLRLADGRTKQVPLSEDRDASRKLL